MKLLEAINNVRLDVNSLDTLNDILSCLKDRLETVESQEPNSDYEFFYEQWEMKHDELEDLVSDFEELVEEIEDTLMNFNNDLSDIQSRIEDYQIEYGGLKRLEL